LSNTGTMPTETLKFREWILAHDRARTREAYASLGDSSLDCSCAYCRNFDLGYRDAYPEEFLALLEALGIAPQHYGEIYALGKSPQGLYHYHGVYHFAGTVVLGPTSPDLLRAVPPHLCITFTMGSYAPGPAGQLFRSEGPVVQLEFETEVPWLVADEQAPEETVTEFRCSEPASLILAQPPGALVRLAHLIARLPPR